MISKFIVNEVKKQIDDAIADYRNKLDWYEYVFEMKLYKYYIKRRIEISGDFNSKKWWFVLREIK